MARKKKDDPPPPGAPGWMTTYGDMMSLLLTFFIMLVSMSTIEKIKFRQAAGSLQGALGIIPTNTVALQSKKLDAEKPLKRRTSRAEKKMRKKAQQLQQFIEANQQTQNFEITPTKNGVGIRITDPNFFETGKAELKQQSFAVLDKIADVLTTVDYPIRIEGHTDDIPIKNADFFSNWELSAGRALSILTYFQNVNQIDPKRLEAVGLGEFHPIVPNNTPENRAKNRRVEIFLLSQSFRQVLDSQSNQ